MVFSIGEAVGCRNGAKAVYTAAAFWERSEQPSSGSYARRVTEGPTLVVQHRVGGKIPRDLHSAPERKRAPEDRAVKSSRRIS